MSEPIYFAKWLPVSGPPKQGDKIMLENGLILPWDDIFKGKEGYDKRAKLFLCTELTKYDIEPLAPWDDPSANAWMDMIKKDRMKAIGVVSEEAVWVQEGDCFTKEQVKQSGFGHTYNQRMYISYRIKCSHCKTFN